MISHSRSMIRTAHRQGLAAVAASHLAAMANRWRERLALGRLNERLLDDIGVSRDGARAEIGKKPWQD